MHRRCHLLHAGAIFQNVAPPHTTRLYEKMFPAPCEKHFFENLSKAKASVIKDDLS